jgi:hypothetical protein
MTAYLVYRSPYDSPLGKHVARLPDDTVLAWFQRCWGCAGTSQDEDARHLRAEAWLRDELGAEVYGLSSIFTRAVVYRLPCPGSERQLFTLLRKHLYIEGDQKEQLLCKPGVIQALTNDDNLDVAYYFCDDAYLNEHARLATFLLHEPWRLPAASGTGGFRPRVGTRTIDTGVDGEDGLYLVVTEESDKCEMVRLHQNPPVFLPGVRLPQLVSWLRNTNPADDWPDVLALLWALLPEPGELSADDLRDGLGRVCWFPGSVLSAVPEARALGRAEASRFLEENRGRFLGEKWRCGWSQSHVQTSPHLAQLCWCITQGPEWAWRRDVYNQWYLFDDCWASANADLADALMRFATRWDVLRPS